MNSITVFEFDKVVAEDQGAGENAVPLRVFSWLESQCLGDDDERPSWMRLRQQGTRKAIQFTSHVGVVRSRCGFQIEVLPKIGRHSTKEEARLRLLEMLQCMREFRHIKINAADLALVRMPLLEVFVRQFLATVQTVVKSGMRSDYVGREGNLSTLRGKLMIAQHLKQNVLHPERFHTAHDEFSPDRAENRLIHSALLIALRICKAFENQRLARELCFVFADIPPSKDVAADIQRIRLDRGMQFYAPALDWATIILAHLSPTVSIGKQSAQSLLFPMEAVFEAFVTKHLARQTRQSYWLESQSSRHHLVTHRTSAWFRLRPDMMVRDRYATHLVLDAKWKLLDASKDGRREKYLLSQADFYQLYAYGHHYLSGQGAIVLIYPKTDTFSEPLKVFEFPHTPGMRLWVLPFCLRTKSMLLPADTGIERYFCFGQADPMLACG